MANKIINPKLQPAMIVHPMNQIADTDTFAPSMNSVIANIPKGNSVTEKMTPTKERTNKTVHAGIFFADTMCALLSTL